jgi:two-component system cell cycle sensor histidine kinase/response regulator CckA
MGQGRQPPSPGIAPAEQLRARIADLEAQLAQATARHATVLETISRAAPIGIGLVTNRVLGWTNAAFQTLVGYTAAELEGQSARLIYPSDEEYERVGQVKHPQILERGVGEVLTKFRRKDGRIVEVVLRSSALDTGDLSQGLIFTALDISQQKRAEAALRESEARFRLLADNIPSTIYLCRNDLRWTMLYLNDAIEALTGCPKAEFLADRVCLAEFIHPEDRQRIYAAVNEALDIGEPFRLTYRIVRRSGDVRWVDEVGDAIREDGKVLYLEGVISDVTERVRMQEQLLRSQADLTALVESTDDFIWSMDRDLRLVKFNSAFARHFKEHAGVTVREGMRAADLLPAERVTLFNDWFGRGLAGERVVIEYRLYHDPARMLELSLNPIVQGGAIVGVSIFGKDITQRLKAEQCRIELEAQLRQSQKLEAIGQLAGGVAHDFNNILTAILGHVELALLKIDTPDGRDEALFSGLQQVQRSAERAARLTRQLLAFGRRQVARPRLLQINDVLTDLEPMLRRLLTENIVLDVIPAPRLATVRIDPTQLEQVIVNLVVNARDAMPAGGQLTIETANVEVDEAYVAHHAEAQPGPHVRLAVTDTGHGMDAGILEHVFEPFFTTKGKSEGTGLGLATVYGIVKQAGGHIAVYSEPDQGATFKVYVPALDEDALPHVVPDEDEADLEGSETVLICEDDIAVRDLAERMLREAGYDVLVARNGAHALELCDRHDGPLDLLISDIIMPGIDGRQLAEALAERLPPNRVLFISGYTSNVVARRGVIEEGVEFLQKPFTRRALLRRVREILDR